MIKMASSFQSFASNTAADCGATRTRRTPAAILATSTRPQYISGIVAGYSSKTGKLGFVAAKPIPQVLRNINALRLAPSSQSESHTQVIFTGDWSMPGQRIAEATNSLDRSGRRCPDLPRRRPQKRWWRTRRAAERWFAAIMSISHRWRQRPI